LSAYCWFGAIADQSKLLKDKADEPFSEGFQRQAHDARDRESDRLQPHVVGFAILWNPPSPSSGAGARSAAKQRTTQLGKLGSARDRRILQ
jgi:hypothetical protein